MNEKYSYYITLEKKLDVDIVKHKPTILKLTYDISEVSFNIIEKLLQDKIIDETNEEIQKDFELRLKQKIKEKINK